MADKEPLDQKLNELSPAGIREIMELNSKDFLWMMGLLVSGKEPDDGITEVNHDYKETVEGKEFDIRLNIFCDHGLLYIQGVTGIRIDLACPGCLMNFFQMANDLMRNEVVYYGKITLSESGYIDYLFCHYIPAGLDLEKLSESWEELGKVAISSVTKDIRRLIEGLLTLSKKAAHESRKGTFRGKGSRHVH